MDINKRVEQYVGLRDKIKSLDDGYKETMKPYRETLEQLNNVLLGHLNTIGGDSVNTSSGTVYRTEKKSASVADMSAFWAFVVTTGDWDLLDKKANVSAVSKYIDEHNSPPPGVNFSQTFVAGVRRK